MIKEENIKFCINKRNKQFIFKHDILKNRNTDKHRNLNNKHSSKDGKIILNLLYTIYILDSIDLNIELFSIDKIIGDNDKKLENNMPGIKKHIKLNLIIMIKTIININKLLNDVFKKEKNKANVKFLPEEIILIKLITLLNKIVFPIIEENIFDKYNFIRILFCSTLILLIISNNSAKVIDVPSYKKDIFLISGVIKIFNNIKKRAVKKEINVMYEILL